MNYVENVAAFLEFCLNNGAGENLFNYCDQPAYDMNTLVFDVYKSLGKTKKHIFYSTFVFKFECSIKDWY